MKWSIYNHLFSKDSHFLLYNSLSNSFVEFSEDIYKHLQQFTIGQEVKLQDHALLADLSKIKAIVIDDNIEYLKLKYFSLRKRFITGRLLLTINPTLNCNFACPYCFEKSHDTSIMMSDDVEKKIINFIKTSGKKSLSITWFGGEPLMGFKRIESLTTKIFDLNLDYSSSMITNGFLLTETIASKLEHLRIHSLQITLDGPSYIHDNRRKLKNGGKTFDIILSNIKLAQKISPKTRINIRVNIDKSNIEHYVELHKQIEELQCQNLGIYPSFVNDSTEKYRNPCVCNSMEQAKFFKSLLNEHGIKAFSFFPSPDRMECAIRNKNTIVIGPKGELYKCWQDVGNPERVYGTIDGEVTNESLLIKYLMAGDPFEDEECKKCILLPICSGGCPYERIKAQETINTDKPCPLYKENLDDFLFIHYLQKIKL